MKENIETKDVQRTEYLDKNGLDMLWAKVKENIHNQVEVERNRAVAKENSIVDTKADKSEFSNYVPSATFTALEKKVSANTAAISGKQDAGRYITYEKGDLNDDYCYIIAPYYYIECRTDKFDNGKYNYSHMSSQYISVNNSAGNSTHIDFDGITIDQGGDASNRYYLSLSPDNIVSRSNGSSHSLHFQLNHNGVTLGGGRDNRVLTSNGSTIDITQYALKSELPTVPTKVSELQNDSEFIVKSVYDEKIAALEARIAALEAKHPEAAE